MPEEIPFPEDLKPAVAHTPDDTEMKRGRRVRQRIKTMLEDRQLHESAMENSLLMYSGKSRPDPKDPHKIAAVAPFAKIFVDAKTSVEVKAMQTYEYQAGKDTDDEWKADLIKSVDEHIRTVVKMGSKKIQAIRMKNITGVSILRIGRRKIMRTIKDPIPSENEDAVPQYKTRSVPMYDDLYLDLVSPFNFAVDPNATSMDDAMDCVHFHTENWETFYEQYCENEMFKNCEELRPGYNGLIDIAEYFNKQRDEWIMFASPATQTPMSIWNKNTTVPVTEIYNGPLPDAHKQLPFISYHNSAQFVTSYVRDTVARSADGSETTQRDQVRANEGFWTEGDPETLMDLINLRTGFSRAAYRAMKKAGEAIIATKPGFVFDESRPWRSGDQAVGAMGKFEVVPMGDVNIQGFQFTFDDIFQQMIMASGIDPRNLSSDQKEITATEAQIRQETSMRIVELGLEFNEENGEVRLGRLIFELIQQWYTKPQLVRLMGNETEDQLKAFDEVEEDPDTGLPFAGKKYRSIKSPVRIRETKRKGKDGKSKYMLSKKDANSDFFLARPEYIRTSDIHVIIKSGRRAGQLQAISIAQDKEAIQLFIEMAQFTQSTTPGQAPILTSDDLPNAKMLVTDYMTNLGKDPIKSIGQGDDKKMDPKMKEQIQANQQYQQKRVRFAPPPTAALQATAPQALPPANQ